MISLSSSSFIILQPLKSHNNPFTLFLSKPYKTPLRMDAAKPKTTTNTKYRRRSTYGTSRKSILKKSFNQEQVNFTAPLPDDPIVAIIGGGMSGLLCALSLEKHGIRSTVFDTGVHGLGGRLGTRVIEPQGLVFDHAAQFFTVSDLRFGQLVDDWLDRGFVRQWEGTVGKIEAGGKFTSFPSSSPRYVGVGGMRPLADSILHQATKVNVVRPCWISKLEPYNGKWYLSENGKPRGEFDAIVIAHNGKCANRLLSTSGLPLIAKQMKSLDLSSIWALMAAFEEPLPTPVPFGGAFVEGVDSLSWMANNTEKLTGSQNKGPQCWTFFSTAAYAKKNKVPQENIPNVTAERVKACLLEGVEIALGLRTGSIQKPFYSKVQLWGAALPTNTPGIPCIFDPFGRAGICGDWLLGSSVESAALSGMALGDQIANYFQSDTENPGEYAVGLDKEFIPLKGHDIGQFPGMEPELSTKESPAYQLAV